MITVRRAVIEDIPMIMQFLDEHWLKGYALAHNRELFDWQFVKDGKVNIWIGVDDDSAEMYAMQGAIVYNDEKTPDISAILWVAKKADNPMLAFDVGDMMWQGLHTRYGASPGIAPRVAKLNRTLGNDVVSLDHYYRLGDQEDYKIALVRNKIIPKVNDYGYRLEPISSMEEFKSVVPEQKLREGVLSKNYRYISWRYFNHPVFKYDIWKITNDQGIAEGVLVTREERANERKACKIVDLYGDSVLFERITFQIDKIIAEREYEYADVYSFGVPSIIYEKGGFVRCDVDSENIITNLFQPYTQKNSEILMINPGVSGLRIFRGDGDQDKPRYL